MPHSHMDASTSPMNTVVIYNHKFDVSFSFTPTVRNFDRLHNPPPFYVMCGWIFLFMFKDFVIPDQYRPGSWVHVKPV